MRDTLKTSFCVLTLLTACGGGSGESMITTLLPEITEAQAEENKNTFTETKPEATTKPENITIPENAEPVFEKVSGKDANLTLFNKVEDHNTWYDEEKDMLVIDMGDGDYDIYGNFTRGKDGLISMTLLDGSYNKLNYNYNYGLFIKTENGYKFIIADNTLDELSKGATYKGVDTLNTEIIDEDQEITINGEKQKVRIATNFVGSDDIILKLGANREKLKYADFASDIVILKSTASDKISDDSIKHTTAGIAVIDRSKEQNVIKPTVFTGSVIGGLNNKDKGTILELDGKLDLTMNPDNTSYLTATFDNWYNVNIKDKKDLTLSDENKNIANEWKYANKDDVELHDLADISPLGDGKVEEVVGMFSVDNAKNVNGDYIDAEFSFGGKVKE